MIQYIFKNSTDVKGLCGFFDKINHTETKVTCYCMLTDDWYSDGELRDFNVSTSTKNEVSSYSSNPYLQAVIGDDDDTMIEIGGSEECTFSLYLNTDTNRLVLEKDPDDEDYRETLEFWVEKREVVNPLKIEGIDSFCNKVDENVTSW